MSTLAEALAPKSDQLNADDLIPGPRTITITDARITKADRQTRITLSFEGDNGKPFKPCKTMGRAMVMVWGVTDEKQMIGKSIRVYRDPDVKFGDQGAVGGIRISHMSHIDGPKTVKLTVSQGKKANFVFQPLPGLVEQTGGKQTAEGFARDHIAALQDAPDVATIDRIIAEDAKGLARLKTAKPELFSDCETAANARRAALTAEGPADSQRGEGFGDDDGFTDDAPPVWQATVDNIRTMITSAMGPASLEAASAELDRHEAALPDDVAEQLAIDLSAKRAELESK